MVKRRRSDDDDNGEAKRIRKQVRTGETDRLSLLSDELVILILSNLSITDLVLCERLSQRFRRLAGDPQLWRARYYYDFVFPRATRIPGIKKSSLSSRSLFFLSPASKWPGEAHLLDNGKSTHWKSQYKLRHNWSSGACQFREIRISDGGPSPDILIQIRDAFAVTADSVHGLRAFRIQDPLQHLTKLTFQASNEGNLAPHGIPTSLSIDSTTTDSNRLKVATGFSDGNVTIHSFNKVTYDFSFVQSHQISTHGPISAISFASPYIIMIDRAHILRLYRCQSTNNDETELRLLSSLKSQTAWPPLSLSLRVNASEIVASIAYSLPTYLSGWSVGIQELRMTPRGNILQSRLTSSTPSGFALLPVQRPRKLKARFSNAEASVGDDRLEESDTPITKPLTLSYSHPYLLSCHADNTLTLYLVHSSKTSLRISAGMRLWGHTSSVLGVSIGERGKAVTAARGGDIRIWDLEGNAVSATSTRGDRGGVQIRPERGDVKIDDTKALSNFLDHDEIDWRSAGRWVAFDDEKVVVLRVKGHDTQSLATYDFS